MITSNVKPEAKVWTEVADSPARIRIRSNALSQSRNWQLYISPDTPPDDEVVGELIHGAEVWQSENVNGKIYILTKQKDDDFAVTLE